MAHRKNPWTVCGGAGAVGTNRSEGPARADVHRERKKEYAIVRLAGLKERVEWDEILCALTCLTIGLGCCDCLLDDPLTEKNPFVLHPLDGLFDGGNNTLLM